MRKGAASQSSQSGLNSQPEKLPRCCQQLSRPVAFRALVFTAGIGENSAEVRAAACANFEFLGLKLDTARNSESPVDQEISRPDSAVRVFIVRAQEDWAIARDCWRLITVKKSDHASAAKTTFNCRG